MTSFDADIGIVGGGPAGARAAELLARRGAEVVVWDPKVPWEKPCGGGLPASSFDTMPDLGDLLPEARRIDAVRFETPDERGFSVRLERPMYMVARRDLAEFQIDRAVDAGTGWIREGILSVEPADPGWRLEGRDGGSWTVRRIVGADGAASLTRRAVSPDLRVELAPTRVCYPAGAGTDPDTVLVRLFDGVHGYFWDFSRPDHRSVGAGVEPGKWNRRRLDGEIDEYLHAAHGNGDRRDRRGGVPDLAPELGGRETATSVDHGRPKEGADGGAEDFSPRTGAVIGTAALGHGDYRGIGGADFALLGDAAGFADPATGEGIQNALLSAQHLASAWDPGAGFAAYPNRIRARMERSFRRSRLLRRILFGAGAAQWLVGRGENRRWARALVSGVMNSTNEHDLSLPGLLRRSTSALVR